MKSFANLTLNDDSMDTYYDSLNMTREKLNRMYSSNFDSPIYIYIILLYIYFLSNFWMAMLLKMCVCIKEAGIISVSFFLLLHRIRSGLKYLLVLFWHWARNL